MNWTIVFYFENWDIVKKLIAFYLILIRKWLFMGVWWLLRAAEFIDYNQ